MHVSGNEILSVVFGFPTEAQLAQHCKLAYNGAVIKSFHFTFLWRVALQWQLIYKRPSVYTILVNELQVYCLAFQVKLTGQAF